ncbi:MAG: TPM domain-containing protein [Sphingomonadaceae bacterium]|nr:TPM domain-containing protein [Sphingomonadaceae bacterium]
MKPLAFIAAALLALLASPLSAAPDFPELTGRVVDNADLLGPAEEAALAAKLESFETTTQRQFVVATVPSLQGYEISDYGYQLGRAWGIGDAERNDGVLLLVAPQERKVRIEVGYGLEPYLTDAMSSMIIRDRITPRFRDGDMAGGIVAGTDAIITQLQLPPEEAMRIAAEAKPKPAKGGGFSFGTIIWLGFLFFFFILPIIRGARGKRYRGGAGSTIGNIILWEAVNAATRGGSSSGGSSWGGGGGFSGGGGGFSGGGGSFGGGGASGGW